MLVLGSTLGSSSSSTSAVGVGISAGGVGISAGGVRISNIRVSSVGISSVGVSSVGVSSVGIVVVVLASGIDLLLGQDLAGVGQGRGGGLDAGGGSGRLLDSGLLKNGTVAGGRRAAIFGHVSVSEDHSQ